MNYIKSLCDHIVEYLAKKDSTAPDKFEAWSENGQLIMNGKSMGEGVDMGFWQYELVIQIEDLPTHLVSTQVIFARTLAWLHEQDEYRAHFGLGDPSVDLDSYKNRKIVSLDMRIPMIEPITLKGSDEENGDVFFGGQWYTVEDYQLNIADEVEVDGGKGSN